MSYLDDELARIEKYIAGLGIKLTKIYSDDKNAQTADDATWCPNEIELVIWKNDLKTNIIFTLLHEIGHQLYYMHHDRPEIPNEFMLEQSKMTKVQRKVILDYEKKGIEYMPTIAIELGLKIKMWRVYRQTHFDIWVFEYFYENGKFPTMKEKKLKKKELTKLYKGKK